MNLVAGAMLVLGFGFILTGVIGILRLPDFYCRLHAMGKCLNDRWAGADRRLHANEREDVTRIGFYFPG
jgi:hypothetical protein